MTMEEKKAIAKKVYKDLGFEAEEFETEKIGENADIFYLNYNQREIGGIIIGDDGSYHICGTIHPIKYYIEEFQKGIRDKNE